jgi:hypothetical protein
MAAEVHIQLTEWHSALLRSCGEKLLPNFTSISGTRLALIQIATRKSHKIAKNSPVYLKLSDGVLSQ